MNKEKIIFLSPVSYFKGGAERSLFDLLSNPDIKPILIAPENGPILEKGTEMGIECHVLPFGSIHNIHRPFSFMKGLSALKDLIKAALKLRKIVRQTGASTVHSNGLKAHAINCTSRCLGGAKSVLHIRDIPYTKAEILVWRMLKTLCNKMILVSHACWPDKDLPNKVIVIHNGTPLISSAHKAGNKLGKHETIRFAFIGRIHPAKGLDLLINWLYEARKENLPATLSIRGTFSEDAPSYEDEINELIKKLDMNDHIKFAGFIDNSDKLYKNIDIVVVPSKVPDPLPRSVMESMARGIPVFGYPAGGIFEMIEEGKTGFLIKDTPSFIKATNFVISELHSMQKITQNAQQKIENEFSLQNLYTSLNATYKNL